MAAGDGRLAPEAFLGRWRIEREIADRCGPDAVFAGQARIEEGTGGWTYHETGLLRFADGGAFEAERRYLWRPGNGAIAVLFDDGRAFHTIPLEGGGDRHLCAPDIYDVVYDLSRWPYWEAVWTVTGPRKDYVMRSRYRQQDLPSGPRQG